MSTVFKGKDITYRVNNKIILDKASFEIEKGKAYALVGCNGSGKTTLMKILSGIILDFEGELYFYDKKIDKTSFNILFKNGYYKHVGYMFQETELQLFNLTVFDEIAFGPRQFMSDENEVKNRVLKVAEFLGIDNLLESDILTLSGGEKKRVALAAILANNPEVLILDEPTNDLDPKSIRFFGNILKQLKDVGKTIIVSTHHFDLLFRLADYTILLSPDHRILKIGPAKEILEDKNLLIEAEVLDEEFEI